jgi:hypothetical protein
MAAEGKPKEKCGSKRNGGTETCKLPAGYGTDHPGYGPCKFHFGCTQAVAGKYRKIMIRDGAIEVAGRFNLDLVADVDPVRALKDELKRTNLIIHVIESELSVEGVMWPEMQAVYLSERQHFAKLAEAMVRLGIEEREVAIKEAEVLLMGQALRQVFDRLQLNEDQRKMAPIIVREVFAALPAAA